jgi:hypothetical protein
LYDTEIPAEWAVLKGSGVCGKEISTDCVVPIGSRVCANEIPADGAVPIGSRVCGDEIHAGCASPMKAVFVVMRYLQMSRSQLGDVSLVKSTKYL